MVSADDSNRRTTAPPSRRSQSGAGSIASSGGCLNASRSAPHFFSCWKKDLHNRGENECGMVGSADQKDAVYVPRATWTESLISPLKQSSPNYSAERYMHEAREEERHRTAVRQYLRQEQRKEKEKKDAMRDTNRTSFSNLRRQAADDLDRLKKEEQRKQSEHKQNEKACREKLDEQMAWQSQKAYEHRLQEAYEGAEIKLRATQQLCDYLDQQRQNKQELNKEYEQAMKHLTEKRRSEQEFKRRENEALRETMRRKVSEQQGQQNVQLDRVKEAMANQDATYKRFAATAGAEQSEKLEKEARRQDRDERHHNMRTDLHYAQREMARERQRHRVNQELDDQLAAKRQSRGSRQADEDELRAMARSIKTKMDNDAKKAMTKRAQELENQAVLVQQMLEKQARERDERPDYPREPTLSSMVVTPTLLKSAESWRTGSSPAAARKKKPDNMQTPTCAKPWVDIERSHGLGGVVGVFAGDGSLMPMLMSTGGRQRLLTKSAELVARDSEVYVPWRQGVSTSDIKAGQKAALDRKARQSGKV